MVIRLIKLLILFSFFSCSSSGKRLELEVLVKDTVQVDEKVLARIYSNNSDWEIIKAYFDCEENPMSDKINVLNETIEGCVKELFVRNDTIVIQFVPAKLGPAEFGNIKVLMKKKAEEYKVLESGFNYVVVKGQVNN
ncbi:hypothetical protein [Aquiflexum sp.]|uniref:hypothetical protein n=1 Tax=Aquiflexum sp. TaxID=1872584 RepID=UPI0035945B27